MGIVRDKNGKTQDTEDVANFQPTLGGVMLTKREATPEPPSLAEQLAELLDLVESLEESFE